MYIWVLMRTFAQTAEYTVATWTYFCVFLGTFDRHHCMRMRNSLHAWARPPSFAPSRQRNHACKVCVFTSSWLDSYNSLSFYSIHRVRWRVRGLFCCFHYWMRCYCHFGHLSLYDFHGKLVDNLDVSLSTPNVLNVNAQTQLDVHCLYLAHIMSVDVPDSFNWLLHYLLVCPLWSVCNVSPFVRAQRWLAIASRYNWYRCAT